MGTSLENHQHIGKDWVSISEIIRIGKAKQKASLDSSSNYQKYISQGQAILEDILKQEGQLYGVTTGYGDSCDKDISGSAADNLSQHLYTFHGCGTGASLSFAQSKRVLAVRLVSLAKGYSGVRYTLLKQIADFINHEILPIIPSEGSVGASGDLTPLSYVAATLCGEREVLYKGQIISAEFALKIAKIRALTLRPKEGIAIMNGTAVMTALAIEAYHRAEYLASLSCRVTSLIGVALGVNKDHFDEFLFSLKPHQGQQKAAKYIREDIEGVDFFSGRLQERYSVRCAPHVIGVLLDAIPFLKQLLENELNSVNDNPIIDTQSKRTLHGGHFYGGHVAFAMDSLKNCVANIADLHDRQMALLVDNKFNHGLPRNLTGDAQDNINHGLKAVQIASSAWTAEALKLTMPASVFSRSTECHNQDKVSMGTISSRDCLRTLQLSEQVIAVSLMASVQAISLRIKQGEINPKQLGANIKNTINEVEQIFPFLSEDTALDKTINTMVSTIQKQSFTLYKDTVDK